MLALLIVGGDPLGRRVSTLSILRTLRIGASPAMRLPQAWHRSGSPLGGGPAVSQTKIVVGGEFAAVLGPHTGRQLRLDTPERRGLRDRSGCAARIPRSRETARAEDRRPLRRSAADGRHIGIERQPREVVAGQEAFGREIAVGVEVRAAARRASLQQRELLVRLGLLDPLPLLRSLALRPCISDLRFASFS